MQRMVHYSLLTMLVLQTGFASADVLVPGGPVSGEMCGACGDGCGQGCVTEGCNSEGCNSEGCNQKGCNKKGCDGSCNSVGTYRLSNRQQRKLNQQCPPVVRWRAAGIDWAHNCGPVGRAARWNVPGARCLQTCMQTKGSPDSGWSPPAHMPVNRNQTGFSSYTSFGGNYQAAPMVFRPTDTAQLGYSYAHVPTWRRNPRMIPPTPNPSAFHARFTPRGPSGHGCYSGSGSYCSPGMGSCPTCYGGAVDGGAYGGSYCPTGNCQASVSQPAPKMVTVAAAASAPRPVPATVVRKEIAVRPPKIVKTASQQTSRPIPVPTAKKLPVRKPSPKQTVQKRPVQKRTTGKPTTRSQQARRQTARKKSSSGWLGLPSLSDVKF